MSMHLRSCFLCLYFRRCIFKILQQKKNKLKSLMGPLLRLSLQQSQCLQACSDYLNLCQTLSIFLKIYFLPSSAQLILTWWKAACQGCKVEHCQTSPPAQLQLHSPAVYTSVARVCVLSKHQGYIEPSSHCLLGWGQEYDPPLSGIFPLLPDQPVIVFESFFICLFWQFSMYDPIATILPILPSSITCPTTNWVASTSLWKTGSFSIGSPVTSNQWENSQSESQRWECDQFKNDSLRAPWICGTSELRCWR